MAGLYIHIPFCSRRCYYCDFFSSAALSGMGSVLSALERELVLQRNYLPEGEILTLYIGGGTPSTLSAQQIAQLLKVVRENYRIAADAEITMEANPDDLSPEYLAALSATGINRLSIGIQSFDDSLLRFMNRRHTAKAAIEAVDNARKAGFDNISIDLMYGIPGLSMEGWRSAVAQAVALGAEHISAYHLTIEPGTVFGKQVERGELNPVEEQVGCDHYDLLRSVLSEAGYDHYEISNFAKPDRRSRHNSSYWQGVPYLGIGPSAHSYNGERRRWNVSSLKDYVSGVDDGLCYIEEILTPEDQYNEYIMTRLRTSQGICLSEMEAMFGVEKRLMFGQYAAAAMADGLIIERDDWVRIPAQHFMISDAVICALFEDKE